MQLLKIATVALCLYSGMVKAQDFRVVGKEKFRVIDTNGFYLYSINKLVQGEKIARPQDVYYFSVDRQSPLLELTIGNLETAFAANTKFRYSVEAHFHSDKDLLAYDKTLKTYKVKYLYSQSYQ